MRPFCCIRPRKRNSARETDCAIYRADLYGSLDGVQSAYFYHPSQPLSSTVLDEPFHSDGLNSLHSAIGLNPILRGCIHKLEDAVRCWSSQMGHSNETSLNLNEAARVRYLITNVQYTLLSPELQQECSSDTLKGRIQNFCRITIILYTLVILNERPPSTSVGMSIGDTFRREATGLMDQVHHSAGHGRTLTLSAQQLPLPQNFVLWAVFLAANILRYTESETKDWLLAQFTELVSFENAAVHDWQDFRTRMSAFLWAGGFHEDNCHWLWSQSPAYVASESTAVPQRQGMVPHPMAWAPFETPPV